MSVDYRCNKCGKLYVDHAPAVAPKGTALVVTECTDCGGPAEPKVLKFFDNQCRRLGEETRRHYAPVQVTAPVPPAA